MQNQTSATNVRVFISYSHADREMAHSLVGSLTGCGVKVWLVLQSRFSGEWLRCCSA